MSLGRSIPALQWCQLPWIISLMNLVHISWTYRVMLIPSTVLISTSLIFLLIHRRTTMNLRSETANRLLVFFLVLSGWQLAVWFTSSNILDVWIQGSYHIFLNLGFPVNQVLIWSSRIQERPTHYSRWGKHRTTSLCLLCPELFENCCSVSRGASSWGGSAISMYEFLHIGVWFLFNHE